MLTLNAVLIIALQLIHNIEHVSLFLHMHLQSELKKRGKKEIRKKLFQFYERNESKSILRLKKHQQKQQQCQGSQRRIDIERTSE